MDPRSEILLVFALVELAVWLGNISKPLSWLFGIIALLGVIYSWYKNPAGLKSIFCPLNVQKIIYGQMYVAFLTCGTVILVIGLLCNPLLFSRTDFLRRFAVSVLFYLGNALWQQVLLSGYFLPKLEQAFQNPAKAISAIGILFALVHLPNPVLVPVTMIGGMLSVYFFRQTRNIYILTIAHAILAVSVMYLFPESWHHHLRIGPGFFHWNP